MASYDNDPDALAWARAKVERVRTKYLDFERQMRGVGDVKHADKWRQIASILRMEFIGGRNCVIAAFDKRLPAVNAALADASRPLGEQPTTVRVRVDDLDLVMNHAGNPARAAEYPAAAERIQAAIEGARRG
uniref:Uncharacterized protein n=1 Tax=Nonomuraea gerenzanensis TaxID=93944 RepID=A0A1M4BKV1_9ACTN|nr:hypothetical protein BN4615_P10941 [Nonomuraea gerenzanensis]